MSDPQISEQHEHEPRRRALLAWQRARIHHRRALGGGQIARDRVLGGPRRGRPIPPRRARDGDAPALDARPQAGARGARRRLRPRRPRALLRGRVRDRRAGHGRRPHAGVRRRRQRDELVGRRDVARLAPVPSCVYMSSMFPAFGKHKILNLGVLPKTHLVPLRSSPGNHVLSSPSSSRRGFASPRVWYHARTSSSDQCTNASRGADGASGYCSSSASINSITLSVRASIVVSHTDAGSSVTSHR